MCVPATNAKWVLFLNHRNRKVVGGKHNVLVHCVNVCAPDQAGVVLWNPFIWDTLWFIFSDPKSCYFCAFHNSELDFIPQPKEQKSGRRQTQYSSTLCRCLCKWLGRCCHMEPFYMRYFVVHFYQKSYYLCAKMNFIPQAQE